MGRSVSTVIKAAFPSYPCNNMAAYNNLTEAEVKKIMEEFRRFDTNGDMYIEPSELKHMLTLKLGGVLTDKEVDRMMGWADTNNDGKVSYGEFFDMIAYGEKNDFTKLKRVMELKQTKKDTEKLIRETFNRFDSGGNGTISVDELREAMKSFGEDLSDEVVDEMIQRADENGNQEIDYEEFAKMVVVVKGKESSFLAMPVPKEEM